MSKLFRISMIAAAAAMLAASPAVADITMDMEAFVGNDTGLLGSYYSGVTFESGSGGSDWVARDATSNNYNISSTNGGEWNGGWYWIYDYVGATTALDYTGDDGIISFDNADATYVELGYTSGSAVTLTAYDSDDNVIDSDTGAANRRYLEGNNTGPGTLLVTSGSANIAYVVMSDSGNFWVIDNITTDASGIVPAPGAILLGAMGLGMVGWIKRRFA